MGWSAAARAKAAAHRRGKHLSVKTRARISAAKKGKKHPHKGHKQSTVTRKKISAALKAHKHKGHKISAATRAKIAAKLKGRHLHHPFRHRKGAGTSRGRRPHAGPHRRPGPNNRVVLAKIARRSVRASLRHISNSTLLQKRLHHRLSPPRHGLTNRRVIRNEHRRRRHR